MDFILCGIQIPGALGRAEKEKVHFFFQTEKERKKITGLTLVSKFDTTLFISIYFSVKVLLTNMPLESILGGVQHTFWVPILMATVPVRCKWM